MIRRSSRHLLGVEGRAQRGVEPRRGLGRRRVERQGDEHGALALDQVVAGRLAGRRRVAEDPEQVVAQLERLAQRQPERRPAAPAALACRRPAWRRCAAAARWSTSRTCSAARSSRRRRRRRPRACTETSRNWPVITSVRHRSKTSSAGTTRSSGSPQRRSSSSDQLSSRSPSRIAADGAVLLRVAAPAAPAGARRSNAAVRGRPAAPGVGGVHVVVVHQRAGVQQLERRAGPHERVLVRRRPARDRVEAPVAEGRAEPLAAGDRRPGLGQQPGGVGAERGEPLGLLVEEVVERRLDPLAERRPGPTRVRCWSRGEPRRRSGSRRAGHRRGRCPIARPGSVALAACPISDHRPADARRRALVLVRVHPAQGRGRRGAALAGDPRAGALPARRSSR